MVGAREGRRWVSSVGEVMSIPSWGVGGRGEGGGEEALVVVDKGGGTVGEGGGRSRAVGVGLEGRG